MRLFQNGGLSRSYRTYFDKVADGAETFRERLDVFLSDRYGASHLLKPVLESDPIGFVTNADDDRLQRMWAHEHGLSDKLTPEAILVAQIEEHRTEVFYNTDPLRYDGNFARKLPSCVKKKICWRAAPSPGAHFIGYDLLLCNFPSIIEGWRRAGLRAEYFAPAHDPRMDDCVTESSRSLDVVFVGGYSRHHANRADVLRAVAQLDDRFAIRFCLDESRLTAMADSPIGFLPPLRRHRLPTGVRRVARGPVFGLELYRLLSSTKIVLNGAINMAGSDRGNMRCFEALGCGALMVSDNGNYPSGFVPGQTMLTYATPTEAARVISSALTDWQRQSDIAERGNRMVRELYSKNSQWNAFQRVVGLS